MNRARYTNAARSEVSRIRRDLDDLFSRARNLDEADELSADINRYICVRLSGFLEQAMAYCGRSACSQGSWGTTQQFALSWLKKTPNPRSDEIVKFVRRFNEDWSQELEQYLSLEERYQSVNALLGIRNDIAHGKSQGMSRARALDYYEVANGVVDFLLSRFEPLS